MLAATKRKLVWSLSIAVVSACVTWGIYCFRQKPGLVSVNVEPHITAVIKAARWSKITGSYWENEMVKQFGFLSSSKEDRLEFLKGIVLHLELDSLRSTAFTELVGDDAAELRQILIQFEQSSQFSLLSKNQRGEVQRWIGKLEVIQKQNAEEKSAKP